MTKQRSILTLILLLGLLDATSAFSPPGAGGPSAPRTRPADATERNYGAHSDIEYSVTDSSPDFESLVQLTSNMNSNTAKRRKHNVMIRPKSLTSRIIKNDVHKEETFPQLLSRDEEAQISNAIRKLRAAIRVRDDMVSNHLNPEDSEFPWQPTETEWALACGMSVMQLRRVMNDGQEARTKLVDANGGLVNSIAMKHFYSVKQANQAGGGLGSILTLQDMIQEGNLGLMEAAERFEPERGNRFSTYATYWIRQRILRSISEYSRIIRLPAHVHQTVRKIHKARKEMEKEIGRTPSLPELAHYLDMSVDKVRKYSDSSRTVLSLELPVDVRNYKGEDTRTLGDRIASNSPTPEEDAQAESLRRDINAVVNELPERERDVLVARFGLYDGAPKTVEETSKLLNISRDRVRLVEARALNKLRHPQRNYKLKEYVGGGSEILDEEESENLQLQMSPERIWSF